MTIILDGSSGVTFPNSSTQASSSVVLQVVNATNTTQTSTASTTFVATSLTASITPKFATSKVYIVVTTSGTNTLGTGGSFYTIYRNSTNLGSGSQSCLSEYESNITGYIYVPVAINYLDAPASTSSISYTLYVKTSSGTAYVNNSVLASTITLMEIAA